jgi:hypothetical protein
MKKIIMTEVKYIPVVIVQVFDAQAPDGSLINASLVELIDIDPIIAVERAKKLFPDRKFARVQQYIEKEIIK